MPGPIKPSEVRAKKTANIPDAVFEVFNRLIVESWDGGSATVLQDEVAGLVADALDIDRKEVYRRHLLDVEESYREQGWDVEYDKPGYHETYSASFRFSHGKRG